MNPRVLKDATGRWTRSKDESSPTRTFISRDTMLRHFEQMTGAVSERAKGSTRKQQGFNEAVDESVIVDSLDAPHTERARTPAKSPKVQAERQRSRSKPKSEETERAKRASKRSGAQTDRGRTRSPVKMMTAKDARAIPTKPSKQYGSHVASMEKRVADAYAPVAPKKRQI